MSRTDHYSCVPRALFSLSSSNMDRWPFKFVKVAIHRLHDQKAKVSSEFRRKSSDEMVDGLQENSLRFSVSRQLGI